MTNDILERDDAFYQKMADEFNAKDPKELNSEGVISLAEAVLSEIYLEIKHVVTAYHISPDCEDVKIAVKNMDTLLGSKYFDILTMGHGAMVQHSFRRKCGIEMEEIKID